MSGMSPTEEREMPALRPDYSTVAIGAEALVWATSSLEPALLDPVAAALLLSFDGSTPRTEVVEDVEDIFSVDRATAHAVVSQTEQLFKMAGLLAGDESPVVDPPDSSYVTPDW